MKVRLCLAVAAATFATASVAAKPQEAVVVTGEPVTLQKWSRQMTRMLDARMVYPSQLARVEPNEGVVRVSFRCSDKGKPTAIALADSSGHRDIDDAALRAVRNLTRMHPLPEGLSHDQRFQAVLLFAKDQESHDRHMAALRADAQRRNAWFGDRSAKLAMGVSPMPVG